MLHIFKKKPPIKHTINIQVLKSKHLRGKNQKQLTIVEINRNSFYLTDKIDVVIIKKQPLEVLAYLLTLDRTIPELTDNDVIRINEQYFKVQDLDLEKIRLRGLQLYGN